MRVYMFVTCACIYVFVCVILKVGNPHTDTSIHVAKYYTFSYGLRTLNKIAIMND